MSADKFYLVSSYIKNKVEFSIELKNLCFFNLFWKNLGFFNFTENFILSNIFYFYFKNNYLLSFPDDDTSVSKAWINSLKR